jgi:phosphoenolpyruvate carboxykinase (ATP)
LRPEQEELEKFTAEWTLLCVPSSWQTLQLTVPSKQFCYLGFTRKVVLIGGTGYTGEMKKGIFSALNFILPVDKNALPMHCSSNVEIKTIQLFSLACQELEKQLYQQIQKEN